MSYKKLAKKLIDQIPDSKMYYIVAYLQGAAIPEAPLPSSACVLFICLIVLPIKKVRSHSRLENTSPGMTTVAPKKNAKPAFFTLQIDALSYKLKKQGFNPCFCISIKVPIYIIPVD